MDKKINAKTAVLLILAFVIFIGAVFGAYWLPLYVTIGLFSVETVLMLFMLLSVKAPAQDTSPKSKEADILAEKTFRNKLTDDLERAKDKIQKLSIENGSLKDKVAELTNANAELASTNSELLQKGSEPAAQPQVVTVNELKTVLFDEKMLEVKETVNFGQIIEKTLASMKSFADKADIRMGYVCSGDVSFKGNAQLLTTMMKNIVDNSVKYMRRAGSLHITVSNVAGDLFIVCKDDGLGISKEELPFIFDLNFQGSNRVSGNGLGLTQARDIVNAYGGTIYAKSTSGAGMGIYIQLPSAE